MLLVEARPAVGLQQPLHGPERGVVVARLDISFDGDDVRQNFFVARQVIVERETEQSVS